MNNDIIHDLSEWHIEFEALQKRVEKEILSLQDDIQKKDEIAGSLQQQIDELQAQEQYKEKYEDAYNELEKEKERLNKLYYRYLEKEEECNALKKELKRWQDWLESKKEVFHKLFSSLPVGEEEKKSIYSSSTHTNKKEND